MTVLTGIGVFLLTIILAGTITAGYHLALYLWERTQATRAVVDAMGYESASRNIDLERQRLERARQRLEIDRERLQVTEKLYPDQAGVWPMLWDGQKALDPNRGVVFSISGGAEVLTPALAVPEQKARLLRAGGGWPAVAGGGAAMLAESETPVNWPSRVPLRGLLEGAPSFRSLALGVAMGNDGPEVVRGDMAAMVHMAVGGSSGWGKSVFLRALAYQLAKSKEPVDLALVDLEGATFAPFAGCDRLQWPIADNEQDALAIFGELTTELDRRKMLFSDYPGVDSLAMYNERAEPIPPVVCLVDEATALLTHDGIESALRVLALRARKYGLWLVLGGQDWKAKSLDTAIRNQLSTRVQFRALSASQSRVLLHRAGAEALDAKGRALAWLPGRDMVEMQAPWISHQDIIEAMTGNGPRHAMPEPVIVDGEASDAERNERIRRLAAEGLSQNKIQMETFGYTGGKAYSEVRRVLNSNGGTTTTEQH